MDFDEVWQTIQALSGSPFCQLLGREFTYCAHEGFLKPSTTARNIPRGDFARAFAARPLLNVRQVKEIGVQGPSYVFAILTDERVVRTGFSQSDVLDQSASELQHECRADGDSTEQRLAEEFIIAELGRQLGVRISKRQLRLPTGGIVEVDGACDFPPILCEAWAHQGPPKAAQKSKVMTDAFKLIYASQYCGPNTRKILVLTDSAASRFFLGRGWMAQALKWAGVEVRLIDLPENLRAGVLAAQKRQFR